MGRTRLTFGQFGDEIPSLPGNEIKPLSDVELLTLSWCMILCAGLLDLLPGEASYFEVRGPKLWQIMQLKSRGTCPRHEKYSMAFTHLIPINCS